MYDLIKYISCYNQRQSFQHEIVTLLTKIALSFSNIPFSFFALSPFSFTTSPDPLISCSF